MASRRECANAVRALSIDAIEKAASGHPGAPLGMAEMAESLWRHFLKHNPADPSWPDRDRFVLSNGHASMLLYSVLHLTGYDLPMSELERFRQWQSATPGHPERGVTPGVEMTTGPLGQGVASAVGMALAEAILAERFNRPGYKIVSHYTYAFLGEGCLMEGVSHEACALAGTWHLGKLIVLFDANGVSIDGQVSPWFNEDVPRRFTAYGWQVIGPIDGHDSDAVDAAVREGQDERRKPTLIICRTHIGYGSPKTDSNDSHGSPLGEVAARATREFLNWHEPPFTVPSDIYAAWDAREKGKKAQESWEKLFASYATVYPDLAGEFRQRMAGTLAPTWPEVKQTLLGEAERNNQKQATRVASRHCLNILVPAMSRLIGGSADLSSSVGTLTEFSHPISPENYEGNYIYYGVREFGMGAIMNGLALHGGFIPYAGTFLAFSDQAKNAIRLSALMNLRVIWIMTHDSIGVGEDGPTHQPIEQLPALRLIPRLHVWRPCDNLETAVAWISAIESEKNPSCLILSRQGLPQLHDIDAPGFPESNMVANIARGGYIIREGSGEPKIILLATGSEVHIAVGAWEELTQMGIAARVVSMPCCEIFDAQDQAWRDAVLPPSVHCRLALEAASADWWSRYTGLFGAIIGMRDFGASAPGSELFERYGFTVANVVNMARELLEDFSH